MTLGEVYDPISPIHVQLIGERGESGPIQIKPGFGTNDRFENDKTYKVVAKVVDIGKVCCLNFSSYRAFSRDVTATILVSS